MNKNIKKEVIVAAIAFTTSVLGFKLSGFGLEAFGKFIMFVSILAGIFFIFIGNVKFWFGKNPPDHLSNKSDQNDE